MAKGKRFIFLSDKFYNDYPYSQYPEIEKKKQRPYIQVLTRINNVLFAIPLRSHINHPFVLWTDEENKKEKYRYAVLRLRFMKQYNLDEYIDCTANSSGIDVRYGELRRFFNIPFNTEGFQSWYESLTKDIERKNNTRYPKKTEEQNNVSVHTVARHEGRDPNRIYRSHLMRHSKNNKGKTKCRTEYNSQLAAFRFPYLYELYKNDIHVSFAFTDNPNQEVDETVALNNFIQLENKRIKPLPCSSSG